MKAQIIEPLEDNSLCWATDPSLLDIFIDEIGCTTELFSNMLNTYRRFSQRRMLHVNHRFPGAHAQ
eukprot:297104-Pyramimonas_sp.AAC.1